MSRISVVPAAAAAILAAATAASAVLPGAASDTAREHTAEVSTPGPNAAAGTHPDGAPEAVGKAARPADAGARAGGAKEGTHGAVVSQLATSTTLPGRAKGAAIAAVASAGRSTGRGASGEHAAAGRATATGKSAKGAEASATGRATAERKRP